jgi:hypothetical protein
MEYLSNVGCMLRLYLNKYSNMMSSEVCHHASFMAQQMDDVSKETILHSLFKSGMSHIQGLE